uniref:RING-type domain-containing protein n=1 Tax=Octopus bimaculoides TaxID=37653 RepID=A0A0L8H944_OCTBM
MMERRIRLKSVNVHITCTLCSGYLIDATTITECLHTFCKSCLVQYLDDNNTCPTCEIVIHQSHPLNYIR